MFTGRGEDTQIACSVDVSMFCTSREVVLETVFYGYSKAYWSLHEPPSTCSVKLKVPIHCLSMRLHMPFLVLYIYRDKVLRR